MFKVGLTLLKNFGPWFIGTLIVGLLLGGGVSSCVTKRLTESKALRLEADLATYKQQAAAKQLQLQVDAERLRKAAADAIAERDRAVTVLVDEIPKTVADTMRPQFAALRRLLDAPEYECLRRPLPAEYIDRLRRVEGSGLGAGPDQ